jgi:curved DNA-binding protein CbpA
MNIKKIEDLDYYELLNVERNASLDEIKRAYLQAVAAYHPGALASYSLLEESERQLMMNRIEEAFLTLSDEDWRRMYDDLLTSDKAELPPRVQFRKSVEKLEIQDAEPKTGFLKKLMKLLFRGKQQNHPAPVKERDPASESRDRVLLRGEFLKAVRLNRGLRAEDVADALKITCSQLDALEADDDAALPLETDFASLLKLYARYLGLGFDRLKK